MTIKRLLLSLFIFLTLLFPNAAKSAEKIAVIYDVGGKFDKSFNESAYNGIEKARKALGIQYIDFEVKDDSQREQAIRRMAQKADLVFVVGYAFRVPLEKVAPKYPDTKFVIIDQVINLPNIRSITFKEHEGSFLVGVIAGMKTETGTVGFIGAMDIPIIRKFQVGYEEGVKYVRPDAKLLGNIVGTDGSAFSDPAKGKEIAISQHNRGADVIFHAAGPTGNGVLQAAADYKFFGIGVDANQNYMHPGFVLTSMIKAIDTAIFNTVKNFQKGQFEAVHVEMGLAEGGVSYALDEYNRSLISADQEKRLIEIQEKIISGEIVVTDHTKQ